MKVRVKVQPSGLLNGSPWPEEGETVDLPDSVAEAMVTAGDLEEVKAAPKKDAAKKVEKRPASQKAVETREKTKG